MRNQSTAAIGRARTLRRLSSESEDRLWQSIRGGKIGFKVRRQYPVGPYVLDFFVHEAMLCIEVDGDQHLERRSQDAIRDAYMLGRGIETLRIPSLDMFDEILPWVRTIYGRCVARTGRDPLDGM